MIENAEPSVLSHLTAREGFAGAVTPIANQDSNDIMVWWSLRPRSRIKASIMGQKLSKRKAFYDFTKMLKKNRRGNTKESSLTREMVPSLESR